MYPSTCPSHFPSVGSLLHPALLPSPLLIILFSLTVFPLYDFYGTFNYYILYLTAYKWIIVNNMQIHPTPIHPNSTSLKFVTSHDNKQMPIKLSNQTWQHWSHYRILSPITLLHTPRTATKAQKRINRTIWIINMLPLTGTRHERILFSLISSSTCWRLPHLSSLYYYCYS